MKTVRMGRTGLKVSEVCLGTMTFGYQCDERTSFAIMSKAAEQGVSFIDTADVYPVPPSVETAGRTEEIVGRWLKGQRDRFVLATKCRMKVGPDANDEGLSRRHIIKAVDDSLRRLQTDYIDLFQPHSFDADTPIEETMRAPTTWCGRARCVISAVRTFRRGWSRCRSASVRHTIGQVRLCATAV